MGFVNNFKKAREKQNNKVKKSVKKIIISALKPILVILLKALIPLIILTTLFDWVIEIFTSKNTPQKIYDYLEVEDVAELIEIKGDENNGYYLDFVDNIDSKIKGLISEINSKAEYHNLPANDVDFVKKMLKAEVFTQFPDLRGTVPKDSKNGFQGAVKIRRVTPNKEPGEMKNTGKGPTSSIEEETVYDTVEITDKNDANRIQSWKEGEQLYVLTRTLMYEELRETGYWQEKLDKDGNRIYVDENERIIYTGNYKVDESALTGDTTVYVEVKKDDGTKGYLKLMLVYSVNEGKKDVNEGKDELSESIKHEDIVRKWQLGKELKIKDDIDIIELKKGDIVIYTGEYEIVENKLYVKVKKGSQIAKVIFSNVEEIEEGIYNTSNEKANAKIATTSRAKGNGNEIIGKVGEQYRVAIAAGHNNTNNTGARSGNLVEEKLTIKVAEKVEDLLSKYSNIEVIQTGSTSENPGGVQVGERTKLARNANPDLCIQIHFNAGGGTGVEVIYKDKDGISQQLAEILSDTISTSMGLKNRQART